MNEPVSKDRHVADGVDALKIDVSVNKEDIIATCRSVNEGGEFPTGKSVINCLAMESNDVEFEVVPSTNHDVHEVLILGECDVKEEIVFVGQSDSDGDGGGANAIDYDTDSLPSTVGNKFGDSLLSGNDGEDGSVNATDCPIDSLPLSSGNVIEDPVLSGNDGKVASNAKPVVDHDVSDSSFLGKNGYNINRQLEPTLEPSAADDINDSRFLDYEIMMIYFGAICFTKPFKSE